MGVTSTCDPTIVVSLDAIEPDFDHAITNEELVAAFEAGTRPVADDEIVDVPVRGNDAINL